MAAPPIWFFITAGLGTGLYAVFCFEIFSEPTKDRPLSWIIHQVWFNALGAATGWAACWLLGQRLRDGVLLDGWTLAYFLLAFIGVTGHMPRTVVGLVLAPGTLFDKVVGGK